MKLAIQRLVRGDDGLTKVIYIDLGTLQQIGDLTGYRIVNSGDLYEEPVASVDDPETPSEKEREGNKPVPTQGYDNDSDPNYGGSPLSPNQNTAGPNAPRAPVGVTQPGAIRTPTARTPAAIASPKSTSPVATSREPSLGPLGGIKTAQGSILPGLDMNRFSPISDAFPAQEATSMPGNPNPSQLERTLQSRQELQNIKDDALGIGRVSPLGTKIAVRPETVGSLPAARSQTMVATRPEVPGSLPASRNVASVPRAAIDTAISDLGSVKSSVPGGGFMSVDAGLQNMDSRRESLVAQKDDSLGTGLTSGIKTSPTLGTKDDAVTARASQIASGMPSRVATRPDAPIGSLPGARISNPSMANMTKDDWAGPTGTTQVNSPEFDRPSSTFAGKEKDDKSIAQSTISAAKTPTSSAERTSGFVSAANNPNRSKTTSYVDAAGYSQVDKTGNRGWRNNNPGNIEASNWTASQPGFIGDDGRFAVFDTKENGIKAQAALLGTKSYKNLSIAQAINRYAPPTENNTLAYTNAVAAAIGVDPNTKMSDLSPSQRVSMVNAMHEVEGSTVSGRTSTSLTDKGVQARDHYTGVGTGSDTPSERNAASRPSSGGISFGSGGYRADSGIGRNDSAGAGRGSSSGGPSLGGSSSSGARSGSQGGSSYGGGSSGPGGSAGKSASGGVSGASRSTAGKGGASPSAGSGGISGASRSTSGKTGGYSSGNTSGTTSGHGMGIGRA